jgi:hypothetical protein
MFTVFEVECQLMGPNYWKMHLARTAEAGGGGGVLDHGRT